MAMRAVISWTGGKDSSLALRLCQLDPRFHVVALVVFRPEPADFKAHPLEVMRCQAEALGLPLHEAIISGPDYKQSYIDGANLLQELSVSPCRTFNRIYALCYLVVNSVPPNVDSE